MLITSSAPAFALRPERAGAEEIAAQLAPAAGLEEKQLDLADWKWWNEPAENRRKIVLEPGIGLLTRRAMVRIPGGTVLQVLGDPRKPLSSLKIPLYVPGAATVDLEVAVGEAGVNLVTPFGSWTGDKAVPYPAKGKEPVRIGFGRSRSKLKDGYPAGHGYIAGDNKVSRVHFEVVIGADRKVGIKDAGSSNGTWLPVAFLEQLGILPPEDPLLSGPADRPLIEALRRYIEAWDNLQPYYAKPASDLTENGVYAPGFTEGGRALDQAENNLKPLLAPRLRGENKAAEWLQGERLKRDSLNYDPTLETLFQAVASATQDFIGGGSVNPAAGLEEFANYAAFKTNHDKHLKSARDLAKAADGAIKTPGSSLWDMWAMVIQILKALKQPPAWAKGHERDLQVLLAGDQGDLALLAGYYELHYKQQGWNIFARTQGAPRDFRQPKTHWVDLFMRPIPPVLLESLARDSAILQVSRFSAPADPQQIIAIVWESPSSLVRRLRSAQQPLVVPEIRELVKSLHDMQAKVDASSSAGRELFIWRSRHAAGSGSYPAAAGPTTAKPQHAATAQKSPLEQQLETDLLYPSAAPKGLGYLSFLRRWARYDPKKREAIQNALLDEFLRILSGRFRIANMVILKDMERASAPQRGHPFLNEEDAKALLREEIVPFLAVNPVNDGNWNDLIPQLARKIVKEEPEGGDLTLAIEFMIYRLTAGKVDPDSKKPAVARPENEIYKEIVADVLKTNFANPAAGLEEKPIALRGHGSSPIIDIAYSGDPKRKLMATLSADGTIRIRDQDSGQPRFGVMGSDGPTGGAKFHPGSPIKHPGAVGVAFRSNVGIVAISPTDARTYELSRGVPTSDWIQFDRPLKLDQQTYGFPYPSELAVSPRGTSMMVVSDGAVEFRNLVPTARRNLQVMARLKPGQGKPTSVAYRPSSSKRHPDGQLIAVGTDNGKVEIWEIRNLAAGEKPTRLDVAPEHGPRAKILSLAFAPPPQRILASADDRGEIRVWFARGRKFIPLRHTQEEPVYALAFSPDGKLLASAGESGTVYLWNVEDGKYGKFRALDTALSIQEKASSVYTLAFSPDGKQLTAGMKNGEGRLWKLDRAGLEESAAQTLRRLLLKLSPAVTEKRLRAAERILTLPMLRRMEVGASLIKVSAHGDVAEYTVARPTHRSQGPLWVSVAGRNGLQHRRQQIPRTLEELGGAFYVPPSNSPLVKDERQFFRRQEPDFAMSPEKRELLWALDTYGGVTEEGKGYIQEAIAFLNKKSQSPEEDKGWVRWGWAVLQAVIKGEMDFLAQVSLSRIVGTDTRRDLQSGFGIAASLPTADPDRDRDVLQPFADRAKKAWNGLDRRKLRTAIHVLRIEPPPRPAASGLEEPMTPDQALARLQEEARTGGTHFLNVQSDRARVLPLNPFDESQVAKFLRAAAELSLVERVVLVPEDAGEDKREMRVIPAPAWFEKEEGTAQARRLVHYLLLRRADSIALNSLIDIARDRENVLDDVRVEAIRALVKIGPKEIPDIDKALSVVKELQEQNNHPARPSAKLAFFGAGSPLSERRVRLRRQLLQAEGQLLKLRQQLISQLPPVPVPAMDDIYRRLRPLVDLPDFTYLAMDMEGVLTPGPPTRPIGLEMSDETRRLLDLLLLRNPVFRLITLTAGTLQGIDERVVQRLSPRVRSKVIPRAVPETDPSKGAALWRLAREGLIDPRATLYVDDSVKHILEFPDLDRWPGAVISLDQYDARLELFPNVIQIARPGEAKPAGDVIARVILALVLAKQEVLYEVEPMRRHVRAGTLVNSAHEPVEYLIRLARLERFITGTAAAGLEEAPFVQIQRALDEVTSIRAFEVEVEGEATGGAGVWVQYRGIGGFVPNRLLLHPSGFPLTPAEQRDWLDQHAGEDLPAYPVEITDASRHQTQRPLIFGLLIPDDLSARSLEIQNLKEAVTRPGVFRLLMEAAKGNRPAEFLSKLWRQGLDPRPMVVRWHSDPNKWESLMQRQRRIVVQWMAHYLFPSDGLDLFGFFRGVAFPARESQWGDFMATRIWAVRGMKQLLAAEKEVNARRKMEETLARTLRRLQEQSGQPWVNDRERQELDALLQEQPPADKLEEISFHMPLGQEFFIEISEGVRLRLHSGWKGEEFVDMWGPDAGSALFMSGPALIERRAFLESFLRNKGPAALRESLQSELDVIDRHPGRLQGEGASVQLNRSGQDVLLLVSQGAQALLREPGDLTLQKIEAQTAMVLSAQPVRSPFYPLRFKLRSTDPTRVLLLNGKQIPAQPGWKLSPGDIVSFVSAEKAAGIPFADAQGTGPTDEVTDGLLEEIKPLKGKGEIERFLDRRGSDLGSTLMEVLYLHSDEERWHSLLPMQRLEITRWVTGLARTERQRFPLREEMYLFFRGVATSGSSENALARSWAVSGMQLLARPKQRTEVLNVIKSLWDVSSEFVGPQAQVGVYFQNDLIRAAGFLRTPEADAWIESVQSRRGPSAGAEEKTATRAEAFAGLPGLTEWFRTQPDLEFTPAAPSTMGVVADLSQGVDEALAALYLPKDLPVLVNSNALARALQIATDRPLEGRRIFVTDGSDYAAQLNRVVGLYRGVESVRVFSTRPQERVQAALDVGGRDIPVYAEGNLTLERLMSNVGAVFNQGLRNFLRRARQAADFSRYL